MKTITASNTRNSMLHTVKLLTREFITVIIVSQSILWTGLFSKTSYIYNIHVHIIEHNVVQALSCLQQVLEYFP